jgi:hypothetical protein
VNPAGTCFAPQAAADVTCDASAAFWHDEKHFHDVYLTNDAVSDAEVESFTFFWDEDDAEIKKIEAPNKVWSDNGPGTPSGKQPTGTELTISDGTLIPGEGGILNLNKVHWDDDEVEGETISFTVKFTDDSTMDCGPFTPSS